MKLKVESKELQDLVDRLGNYDKKCSTAFSLYGGIVKKDLENKAKKGAKWENRSGEARRSIKGRYRNYGDKFEISLEGYAEKEDGEDYFQYLELYHNKKNAILYPTIEENADEVLDGFIDVLSKIEL